MSTPIENMGQIIKYLYINICVCVCVLLEWNIQLYTIIA